MSSRSAKFGELRAIASVVFSLAVLGGCGGGGDGTTNPPPPPPGGGGFTISASSATSSVEQGSTSTVTVTIARTGSFTGPVSLQPTGMPAGVTAAFNPASVPAGQTTSTLTFTAIASAAPGTVTITVIGNGSGAANQTLTIQLTVTSAPAQTGPFTLSISATSFLVHPSGQLNANPIVTITRNAGFTGSVALTITGLPQTLFVGFTPSTTTGNTSTAIPLSVGAPNGTYNATITGSSAQGNRSIPFQVVVAPPSTGNIKWKFCTSSLPRYFVAARDGNGPWTRLMPANDTSFSFSLPSGSGSLAEVTLDSGGFRTTVYSYTAQEMAARAAAQCALFQNLSTRTANGSFGGVTGFRTSQVGMGWWFGSANGNGTWAMQNLPAGPLDVIAARNGEFTQAHAMPVDRMIIRRGLNPASGATIPVLDFNAAESFDPTIATWNFGNVNAESFSVSQSFTTVGGSTASFPLIGADGGPTTRTVYGVPLAQTLAGDLHQVIATVATTGPSASSPLRATRQIVAYHRTIGNRTINFGPAMPAATVTAAAAGRLRAQGTVPTEYNTGVAFDITQSSTARFFSLYASRGFLGAGTTYDVQMPDLSGAIGWDTQFAIRAGIATNWWVGGGGVLDFFDARNVFVSTKRLWAGVMTGITAPSDGLTLHFARTVGVATP